LKPIDYLEEVAAFLWNNLYLTLDRWLRWWCIDSDDGGGHLFCERELEYSEKLTHVVKQVMTSPCHIDTKNWTWMALIG